MLSANCSIIFKASPELKPGAALVLDLVGLDNALAGADLVLTQGDELKLVYPQPDAMPERFQHLAFKQFYLQPMDGPDREDNTRKAVAYCLEHPKWRLSLQTHKLLGID